MSSNSSTRSVDASPTKKRRDNRDGLPLEGGYPYPHHYGYAGGPAPPYGGYTPHFNPSPNYGRGGPPPGPGIYCQPSGEGGYPPTGPYIHGGQPPPYGRPWDGSEPVAYSSNSAGKTPLRSPPEKSGRMPESANSESNKKENEESQADKDKGRGSYRCGKCGVPKKGHVCPYQPKLKRRSDEPPPEMRNAATQVEMDEFLVVRRLNLEIQGFPESYTAAPMGDVGTEVHPLPSQEQSIQGQAVEMNNIDPSSNMGMMSGIAPRDQGHSVSTVQHNSFHAGTDPMEENMDEMGMNSPGDL